jgi:hypothetical protein
MANDNKDTSDVPETRCTSCMSPIPKGAKVCLHCKAYQKRWLNILRYVAAISGVLAIAGSLLVFTMTKLPEARKIVAWRDSIQVLFFDDDKSIIVLNTGDGDMLLQYVLITKPSPAGDGSYSIPINEVVKAGRTVTHRFANSNASGSEWEVKGDYVVDGNETTAKERVEIAKIPVDGHAACHSLELRLASDEGYQQVNEHYQKYFHAGVMTIPFTAKLFYYSIEKDKKLNSSFDIVAMVLRSPGTKCAKN